MKPKCCGKLIIMMLTLLLMASLLPVLAQESQTPPALPEILEFDRKLCPVCLEAELAIKAVQDRYPGQFVVRYVHIDEEPNLFRHYKVALVPTQIFLDATGKQVFRHEGVYKPVLLEKKLRDLHFIKSPPQPWRDERPNQVGGHR
jgi:thioredoxin 1